MSFVPWIEHGMIHIALDCTATYEMA